MITEKQKREYLQIARLIDAGAIPVPVILEDFEEQQERAEQMVNFWLTYNEFTQQVVHYLAIEKLKIKFENCYRKELPQWHLKTISYGLTRIISILKKIITNFGFQTSNKGKKQ